MATRLSLDTVGRNARGADAQGSPGCGGRDLRRIMSSPFGASVGDDHDGPEPHLLRLRTELGARLGPANRVLTCFGLPRHVAPDYPANAHPVST